jgi:type VI secretion system protein VasJ
VDQKVNKIESLLAPISSELPTGTLAIYEPDYELVKKQIDILSAPDPSSISWSTVMTHCGSLLQDKSKDLTLTSYYVVAKFEVDKFQGLEHGVELLAGILERYWENLFPELRRKRGRINALIWMLEKLEISLKKIPAVVEDKESIQAILANTKKIEEILEEKLEDMAPQLATVNRLLTSLLSGLPKPMQQSTSDAKIAEGESGKSNKPTHTQNDTQTAGAIKNTSPDLATSKLASATITDNKTAIIKLASDSDALEIMRGVQKNLMKVASHYQSISLKDHRSYQLSRMASWLLVDEAPMHNGDGITPFSAPPKQQRDALDKKLSNKEFELLLRDAELQFIQNPYWLDSHRYSFMAMEGLGDDFSLAKRFIVDELKAFIARFPEILDLKFKNGVGFAGDDTLRWIMQFTSQKAQADVSIRTAANDIGKELQKVVGEATVLAGKGKFKEGLVLFQNTLTDVVTERDRFMLHLQQAIYCFNADHLEIAVPQLEYLDAQSKKFSLQAWEPELVAELIRILLLSYVKLLENNKKTPTELSDQADELFARLCQLNMTAALEIDSKKWQ